MPTVIELMWVTAASGGNDIPFAPLLTYGPLGFFAAFGLYFFKTVYERIAKERDEERAYSRELEKQLREQILPLLVANSTSTADVVKVIAEARAELTVLSNQRRENRQQRDQ